MSMGHLCKFFGYSISYTELYIPVALCNYLLVLLNPLTYSPRPVSCKDWLWPLATSLHPPWKISCAGAGWWCSDMVCSCPLGVQALRSPGVSLSPCVGSLRGTAWGSRSFFHRLNPCCFLQPEVVGTYFPATGTLGWEAWCGAGTPRSQGIPPEFLSTTRGWETSPFCICAPPTILDGCGFFNSVVVRLPFHLIFDGSEWCLFYILVVILMWLCEEASRVCLCRHLDWKYLGVFLKLNSAII